MSTSRSVFNINGLRNSKIKYYLCAYMPHGIPRLFIKSKETSVIFDCKVTAFACHPQYSKIVKVRDRGMEKVYKSNNIHCYYSKIV